MGVRVFKVAHRAGAALSEPLPKTPDDAQRLINVPSHPS